MLSRYNEEKKFLAEKKEILSKADMSKKGKVDDEIKDLVDLINNKTDYCTTSSCAGRITLLERKTHKKIDAKWLYSSHQPVKFEEVRKYLKSKSDVWLMQESCIIHVFCRTLEAAEEFLKACRRVGFKRSGIIALKNKIMIESMGNEKIEALLIKEGKILVDDECLKILVEESNIRMRKNREKMKKLDEELRKLK